MLTLGFDVHVETMPVKLSALFTKVPCLAMVVRHDLPQHLLGLGELGNALGLK